MTLAGLVVLVTLGLWQLERGRWKSDLLSRIEARVNAAPGEIAPRVAWPNWSAGDDEYRRVRLSGIFMHDKETLVRGNAPKDARGHVAIGFFVVTPLRLTDGASVLVNRGFVPDAATLDRSQGARPQGEVTVTGLVRASQTRGWFVPANDPARDAWFTRDIDAIAHAKNLSLPAPFLIDADADASRPWPKGGLTVIAFPNNHLAYALTWFGLACALIAVFAVFARASDREDLPPAER